MLHPPWVSFSQAQSFWRNEVEDTQAKIRCTEGVDGFRNRGRKYRSRPSPSATSHRTFPIMHIVPHHVLFSLFFWFVFLRDSLWLILPLSPRSPPVSDTLVYRVTARCLVFSLWFRRLWRKHDAHWQKICCSWKSPDSCKNGVYQMASFSRFLLARLKEEKLTLVTFFFFWFV